GSTVGVEVDLHPASVETIRRSIDRPQLGHGLTDVGVRLDVDVFAAGRQRLDLCLGLGDLGVDVDLGLAALALELTDPRLGLGNVRINFNVDLGPPSLHGTELGLEFLILEVGLDVDLGPPSLHAAELGLEFLVLEVGLDVDLAVPRAPVYLALDPGVAQPRININLQVADLPHLPRSALVEIVEARQNLDEGGADRICSGHRHSPSSSHLVRERVDLLQTLPLLQLLRGCFRSRCSRWTDPLSTSNLGHGFNQNHHRIKNGVDPFCFRVVPLDRNTIVRFGVGVQIGHYLR